MTTIDRKLHEAVNSRNEALAAELLRAGASATALDPESHTPLHWAAQHGLLNTAQRLLDMGVDPNAKSVRGHTPLHYAAAEPNVEIVKKLLKYGADPNARDERGFTPLGCAAAHWTTEIVLILLDAGADPNVRSEFLGIRPLHEAGSQEIAKLLIERGADPKAIDDDGRTPLDWAIDDEREEVISALRNETKSDQRQGR